MASNKVKVSYATGRYEDYDNTKYVEGRIYYLVDTLGNSYIYLNGKNYVDIGQVIDALTWKTLSPGGNS